jgi:NADH-quinone oxidoreductase subunit J
VGVAAGHDAWLYGRPEPRHYVAVATAEPSAFGLQISGSAGPGVSYWLRELLCRFLQPEGCAPIRMTIAFAIICILTVASAVAAMTLRNLVHCALSLAVTFGGLAALYLQLEAQFAGFAQILVYIGAVAILIVFAILLTRGSEPPGESLYGAHWLVGVAVALVVFVVIAGTVLSSKALEQKQQTSTPSVTVRQLGDQLMSRYVLPLEVLGLLLTAAMIGAVILAMRESRPNASGGKQ